MNRKPTIRIVADEAVARTNLENILKKEDYAIATAHSGVEALKILDSSVFDVILTDIHIFYETLCLLDKIIKCSG